MNRKAFEYVVGEGRMATLFLPDGMTRAERVALLAHLAVDAMDENDEAVVDPSEGRRQG